jgi:2-methylcitrate dehydratase
VTEVRVRTLTRAADILADPSKYDPRTKETADHSLPYVIAASLVDRRVTPEQFEIARILDPTIREQLPKIKVTADPEIDAAFPAMQRATVTIVSADGRELSRSLDYPKGDPRNPMTDVELQDKFDVLASPVCSPERLQKMKTALRDADRAPEVSELLADLKADRLRMMVP